MKRCKDLARVIKAQRTPPWPTLPTTDLPSKGVADELLDCYLRTVETTFRILHIPTFKTEYDALWVSGAGPSMAFTVQLKLILAIGAITYDARFSLRSSAIRWVYEAHTWLSDPDFKPRLNIQCLQSRILLLIARETINVSGDSIWISAGALLRTAMHMGMHRDPSHLPTRSKLAAEMRRRLWNTILELSLQASIMAGGAPLISTDDFDCEMPGNFDDDQLLADEPTPKSDNDYTQTSIARELRKMYPQRLAIARFLNDLTSYSTFEQTLRLDTQLRASYRAICKNLRGYKPNGNGRSMSQFETRTLDFIVHYYLCCLHLPFFEPPTGEEAAYAFSRKVAVESAIKIWYAIYPSPPIGTTTPTGRDDSVPAPEQDDMTRFVSCGFGFFRTGTMVATMLVSSELRAQLQDDDSLAPSPFRHDLFAVLTDAKDRFWDMIECGETNVKGFVLTSIVLARVEGLVQGLDANKFPEVLLRAAEQAEERCIAFMEDKAAQRYNAVNVDAAHEIPGNTSPFVGDWDCIVS